MLSISVSSVLFSWPSASSPSLHVHFYISFSNLAAMISTKMSKVRSSANVPNSCFLRRFCRMLSWVVFTIQLIRLILRRIHISRDVIFRSWRIVSVRVLLHRTTPPPFQCQSHFPTFELPINIFFL